MVNAYLVRRISAPAGVVWNCFKGPDRLKMAIGVYAKKVEEFGTGVGSFKTIHLINGGVITERTETLNEVDFHWTYRIVDNGPLPYTDYLGEVRITPCGPEACVVKFQACFTPVDIPEKECIYMYQNMCNQGIIRLREILESS